MKLSQNNKDRLYSAGSGALAAGAGVIVLAASGLAVTGAIFAALSIPTVGMGVVGAAGIMMTIGGTALAAVTAIKERKAVIQVAQKAEKFRPVSAILAGTGTLLAAFTLALALKTNEAPKAPAVQQAPHSQPALKIPFLRQ